MKTYYINFKLINFIMTDEVSFDYRNVRQGQL